MDPNGPDDDITLPNIFAGPTDQPAPAAQQPPGAAAYPPPAAAGYPGPPAWPAAPDEDTARHTLLPGWTEAPPSEGSVLPPRSSRRRSAVIGILGVVAATVVVLVVALWIAPNWGTSADTNRDAPPTAPIRSTQPLTSGPTSVLASPFSSSPDPASAAPTSSAPAQVTVTVTQKPSSAPSASAPATITTPTPKATPKPAPKPTPTPKPTPKPSPLGVPAQEIACGDGYVVQLASELNAATFAARVAALRAAGQLPAGAKVADSTKSCGIFSNQRNTLVLWAGPFPGPYDGCSSRLSGPYDAFIKGANPDTASKYVSCLCPAKTRALPTISQVGETGVWIGELQRVLGNKLNIDVGPLGATGWGNYTAGTKAAVVAFQKERKIPADGVVNGRTWKALQSAQC